MRYEICTHVPYWSQHRYFIFFVHGDTAATVPVELYHRKFGLKVASNFMGAEARPDQVSARLVSGATIELMRSDNQSFDERMVVDRAFVYALVDHPTTRAALLEAERACRQYDARNLGYSGFRPGGWGEVSQPFHARTAYLQRQAVRFSAWGRAENYSAYPQRRATLRILGERVAAAIADPGDRDAAEALFESLRELDSEANSLVVDIWEHMPSHGIAQLKEDLADNDNAIVRAECGHLELEDERVRVLRRHDPSERWCRECAEGETAVAAEDGETYARDDLYYWDSDDEYHLSQEESDDDSDCDPDERLEYDTNVMDFLSIDPSFRTSAYGDFHMGIELETDLGSYQRSAINAAVRGAREQMGSDYVVGKYDGSVGECSIEFVTRPTSMATHLAKWGAYKPPSGMRAWSAGSCGMHVHIDSRAFTALSLGKLIQFMNRSGNAAFIRQIAGRHPAFDEQARDYASFDFHTGGAEVDVHAADPVKAAKGKSSNRYTMVNTSNLDHVAGSRLGLHGYGKHRRRDGLGGGTVEIRLFRATLRKERLLAQIEFAHALVLFCRTASYRALSGEDFVAWLRTQPRYRNLHAWYSLHPKHGVSDPTKARAKSAAEDEAAVAV